jgi:HKD family nuclease
MASPRVAFEVIENTGPNNLRDVLKAQLARASEVCIAVAFVTEAGLDEIIQPLRQVAAQGKVRLITGLYQRVTEPKALRTLLRIQKETRGKFSVRLSREPQFHRKVFLLENRTQTTAIIGSSNLTREGLRSGGELDMMVSLPKDSPSHKRLKEAFEKDWKKRRSVSLTAEQIERYESVRPASVRQKGYTTGQLKKILGAEPSHQKATTQDESVNLWRDCITGFVKNRTKRIVSENTNWDDRNYIWFSVGGPHPYQIGDRIFLFDFTAKRLNLIEVKDITRTPIPTPDGRHFVAYRQVRNYSRRFSIRLWEQLACEGISEKEAQNTRQVDAEIARRLMSILRNPKK